MEESDGAREESEEVMTKSRMWFLLWVGKVTPSNVMFIINEARMFLSILCHGNFVINVRTFCYGTSFCSTSRGRKVAL